MVIGFEHFLKMRAGLNVIEGKRSQMDVLFHKLTSFVLFLKLFLNFLFTYLA